MMVGKAVGLGFEIISKLDSYFLMTVPLTFESSLPLLRLVIHVWMVLAVLNIFFLVFSFVLIIGDIAAPDYEKGDTDQNTEDIATKNVYGTDNKWKNGYMIMTIVAFYIGGILLFIKVKMVVYCP